MKPLSLCLILFLSARAYAQSLPKTENVPGGVAAVEINDHTRPMAFYRHNRVMVIGHPGDWTAVVGIPLDAGAGIQQLIVRNGKGTAVYDFDIADKQYAIQRITIRDKRKVNPTQLDMKRINRETALIQKAKATWSDRDEVPLSLDLPVTGPYSSPFGLRRFFNGQPRKPHSGLDIVVPEGTPIRAPAAGKIINTGNYFFNGNSVFIDHGQGLVTMYCHMQRIDVKQGQRVARGEIIGRVGKTGRATGAHLHWSVILNKTVVDPVLFLNQSKK